MKNIFFICIIMIFVSCTHESSYELTAEQRSILEQEVIDEFDKLQESITELNFDAWVETVSDEFISGFGRRGYMPDRASYVDTVRNSFALRDRHQHEIKDLDIEILTPELALLTQTAIWENWLKDGTYRKSDGRTTYVWKKGTEGWKVIHVHESSDTLEEILPETE